MTWKKCMALAIAAGAALFLSVAAPVWATQPGPASAIVAATAIPQDGGNVIEAGYKRRGGHGRHGHRRHGWYGRHGYHRHRRHRHRHHDGIGVALPLLAVPLIIESERHQYDHGDAEYDPEYAEGLACYKRCREYNDADYCRYNHRDYC